MRCGRLCPVTFDWDTVGACGGTMVPMGTAMSGGVAVLIEHFGLFP